MKKINNPTKQNRSFRRFVRRVFSSLIKRQRSHRQEGIEKIREELQDIKDSIEIIARQIARWVKPGK